MAAVDTLLEQALQLPEQERSELVARLLRSFESTDDEDLTSDEWEAAWAKELDDRNREVRDGTADLVDGDAVLDEARSIVRSHRP